MQIGVAYSEQAQQIWLTIEVPDEATVKDAIEYISEKQQA